MKNLFDKETSKKIDMLNKISDLNHRSKPYDFNNSDDMKELLRIKVCALLDYCEYSMELNNILERLDESIEYYDTATWLSFTMDVAESDKTLIQCYKSVRKACNDFSRLETKTEKECNNILNFIINSDNKTQRSILGFTIDSDINIERLLEYVFDNIYDVENDYVMEQAFTNFVNFFKECLIEYEKDIGL